MNYLIWGFGFIVGTCFGIILRKFLDAVKGNYILDSRKQDKCLKS